MCVHWAWGLCFGAGVQGAVRLLPLASVPRVFALTQSLHTAGHMLSVLVVRVTPGSESLPRCPSTRGSASLLAGSSVGCSITFALSKAAVSQTPTSSSPRSPNL